jgi:signal transduction histidine kinase
MTAGPGARAGRWRRLTRRVSPRTVRTRVTVVAGLALTAAVLLGLIVMYPLQLSSADRTVQTQLRAYAAQVEQAVARGAFPRPLPGSALDPAAQAQVLAPDGTVLAATRTLAGLPALYRLPAGSAVPVRQQAADGILPGELFVFGEHATAGGRPVIVITSTATSLRRQVNETFAQLLVIGVPGLLILACATIWLVVGRALRPVERIRRAAGAITHADLSRRVPEPGTDDEIGRLAHTMNDMLTRLANSAARERRFVADASHELRTPLTAIRASLEVGLAHPESAPWPDIARRAARQSGRLQELTAQLLLLAKSDAGQLAGRREQADLSAMLTEMAAAVSAPGISVRVSVPPGTTVTGSPEELSRLFRNLVDNAVRYARRRVVITARVADPLVVEVIDDGPGIPASERERVFGRFVRLDPGRGHVGSSSGLGLAIAREIATAHGATIVLAEAKAEAEAGGGGTRAVVTFAGPAKPRPRSEQRS